MITIRTACPLRMRWRLPNQRPRPLPPVLRMVRPTGRTAMATTLPLRPSISPSRLFQRAGLKPWTRLRVSRTTTERLTAIRLGKGPWWRMRRNLSQDPTMHSKQRQRWRLNLNKRKDGARQRRASSSGNMSRGRPHLSWLVRTIIIFGRLSRFNRPARLAAGWREAMRKMSLP